MTVEQLNVKYGLVDRKKDYEVIDFFEKNSVSILNLEEAGDIDTLTTKVVMLSEYAYSIYNRGQYEKSIPLLTESIRLHEFHPTFEENIRRTNQYEYLLFALGQSLYKTGKIIDSVHVFEKLVNVQPDSDKYKNWIVAAKNHPRRKVINIILIPLGIWLLVSLFFRDWVPTKFDFFFKTSGLLLFATWGIIEVLIYRTKLEHSKITPHNKMYKS